MEKKINWKDLLEEKTTYYKSIMGDTDYAQRKALWSTLHKLIALKAIDQLISFTRWIKEVWGENTFIEARGDMIDAGLISDINNSYSLQ